MKNPVTLALVALLSLSLAGRLSGASQNYDFGQPKGVNYVRFALEAPFEFLDGKITGVTGTVHFDPAHPEETKGLITLDANSFETENSLLAENIMSKDWLDAKKFPAITFEADSVKNVKKLGDMQLAEVAGKLTVKGVTRPLNAQVSFTYIPAKKTGNAAAGTGDTLLMKTQFHVKRSEFGIQPGKFLEKVAETIDLTLSIRGTARN